MMLALLVLLADAASLMAAGDKAYAAKDFRTALFAYQDATREDPSSAIVLVKLGQTYARMGHDPEAIEQFQRALKLDRGNSAALQGLAAARERLAILSPPKPAAPPPKVVDQGRRVLPGVCGEHRAGRAAATPGLCGAQCAGARKSLDFPGTCRGTTRSATEALRRGGSRSMSRRAALNHTQCRTTRNPALV